ncbi:MAG: hypothetical protein GY903_31105 [Fuerstiella sp.]|nr:hypothetical protein [Fuerstiella sp.]MCP4858941.1 hypothetical protein [Fuerstiella sp.]
MLKMLKELLSSKKAVAAVAGVLVLLAGRIGLNLPEETALEITGIVIAYLLGQGLADVNKPVA